VLEQDRELKDIKVSIDDISAQSRAAALLILYDSGMSKRDLLANIFYVDSLFSIAEKSS
jgi:hypothetical protein